MMRIASSPDDVEASIFYALLATASQATRAPTNGRRRLTGFPWINPIIPASPIT
jgi:hypothetical protein